MCGFCGIHDPGGLPEEVQHDVRGMTRLMAERGPDAEGFYFTEGLALGHRRLTVIDLDAGEQPVFNETRKILVVYNGEIFNYQELRTELERRGHRFSTATDTEVIVHAYEEYGVRCVEQFRGMFAFALYDAESRSLFLARDRLGVKPLYYARRGRQFLFASEIKPLLLALRGESTPDEAAIDFFTSIGYVPGDRTIFRGIHKLLPGHSLLIRSGDAQVRKFWEVPDGPPRGITENEALEEFGRLLHESVRLRLISDVPVGAFLSGGVDSSVIVAHMAQLAGSRVRTYSVGYDDSPEHSELRHARQVADHLGTDHTEHILTHGDFFSGLEAFVLRSEEPIVESAGIALYELARRARREVTVVLSGEGGDEILAGYPLYRIMSRIAQLRRLLRPTGLTTVAGWLAGRVEREKVGKYLDWIATDVSSAYWSIPNDLTRRIRDRMFSPEFRNRVGTPVDDYFSELFGRLQAASTLQRMSFVDLKSWLPDDLLIKADKMTMAASVELRVPFLDHKLLEFCLTLPDELRLHGDVGKYLLKQHARRLLPAAIIDRKKQGFPVPIGPWFRGPLHARVAEILLDPRSLGRGYFRRDYIADVLQRHRSGREDLSRRILTLLVLEIWHRIFADQICAPVRQFSTHIPAIAATA